MRMIQRRKAAWSWGIYLTLDEGGTVYFGRNVHIHAVKYPLK